MRRSLHIAGMLTLVMSSTAFGQARHGEEQAACAACGLGITVILFLAVAIFVLNIALLVWVAKDSKARGMGSGAGWMVLVLFTGLIGLVIYLLARPQGTTTHCPHCNNKRLEKSAACPHCGNA